MAARARPTGNDSPPLVINERIPEATVQGHPGAMLKTILHTILKTTDWAGISAAGIRLHGGRLDGITVRQTAVVGE